MEQIHKRSLYDAAWAALKPLEAAGVLTGYKNAAIETITWSM